MSYREENGQVVLTMSREDYEIVRILVEAALPRKMPGIRKRYKRAWNRLNEGNPNYTPYEVKADAKS